MEISHASVLSAEVLHYLGMDEAEHLLIDATVGEGGHSYAFLERFPNLRVIGLDADSRILGRARERLAQFEDRVELVHTWFDDYFESEPGPRRPTRVLFDLGVSSFHFKASGGGFSFREDEPLDMRLNPDEQQGAAELVNCLPQHQLADLIYRYGEERYSRRIAAAIARKRADAPLETSAQLADLIYHSVPAAYRRGRIHPATRTFQALRIAVNRELERIARAIPRAIEWLAPGGAIGVIAFHSLEDRIVKQVFREKSKACTCPPEMPICNCGGEPVIQLTTRKPVFASEAEMERNAASRTARLRVARKC